YADESFFSLQRTPPSSPLFPYTTLFRSRWKARKLRGLVVTCEPGFSPRHRDDATPHIGEREPSQERRDPLGARGPSAFQYEAPRSEEHTSELQSPCNLVCRLLLEKKKKK